MKGKGFRVQGSDLFFNKNIERLKKEKIKIFIGQKKQNLKDVTIVVVSSAIKKNNPEMIEAYIKKIPLLTRADMLSELMKNKKSIAIAGSHGKTTTTSLVGNIFNEAGLDPTIVNGGIINSFSNNNRYGKGEWMIVEADESDGTFLKLPHQISIITNLDIEHMDFYKSKKNLINAFEKFINLLPFYGTTIMCYDDKNLKLLINKIKTRNILTYSIKNKKADVLIFDIIQNKLKTSFKLKINNKITHSSNYKFTINAIGNHNILNATASIVAAKLNGIKNKDINNALTNYVGVKRRFSFLGKKNMAFVYDDYAHHPNEIKETIKLGRLFIKQKHNKECQKSRLIAIFQPHRYSRVKQFTEEFAENYQKQMLFM